MTRLYDITLTVSNELPVWPGDQPVQLDRTQDMRRGDLYNLSRLSSTVHLGTHLDAPRHFLRDGPGVDQIDLNKLIGPCFVVDLPDVDQIDVQCLEQAYIPAQTTRLLCRTRNSRYWAQADRVFHTDFVAIEPSGAEWIVQRGIQLIGIDYFSVGPYDSVIPTHEILLRNGVVAVEALDLSHIEPGAYQLICLPLKLKDCDGAPVRAVLVRDE